MSGPVHCCPDQSGTYLHQQTAWDGDHAAREMGPVSAVGGGCAVGREMSAALIPGIDAVLPCAHAWACLHAIKRLFHRGWGGWCWAQIVDL